MSAKMQTEANEQVLERIRAEFLEMPGLQLTCEQAQRLWDLDESTCRRVLQVLKESKFLYQSGSGMYARRTEDRAPWPYSPRHRENGMRH